MAALVLLLLIAALGAVAVVAVAVRQPTATGPVLTVREYLSGPSGGNAQPLRYRLRLNQVIRLRGVLQPPDVRQNPSPMGAVLYDAASYAGEGVAIYYGPSDSLAARLRGLPLLARLVPLPPTADRPLLGQMATYRLRAIRCTDIHPVCNAQVVVLQLADGGTP